MYFFLSLMLIIFGISIAGMINFIPPQTVFYEMPAGFGPLMFIVGIVIALVGFFILWMRAKRVGADVLIAPARPNKIVWLYIHKDDIIEPIMVDRGSESTVKGNVLNNPSIVYDMKAYKIGDHSARLVLDSVGHTIDARMAVYCSILRREKNIKSFGHLRAVAKEKGQITGEEPEKSKGGKQNG